MEPKTREEILAIYKRRTGFLMSSERSPVPLEARQRGFKGCEYFPIDTKYPVQVETAKKIRAGEKKYGYQAEKSSGQPV